MKKYLALLLSFSIVFVGGYLPLQASSIAQLEEDSEGPPVYPRFSVVPENPLLNELLDGQDLSPTGAKSLSDELIGQGAKAIRVPSVNENGFSGYPLVLWDYGEGITNTNPSTAASYWNQLINFIHLNNITRLITYIKDPGSFSFFSLNNSQENSFISFAKKLPSKCELAVLFDRSAFNPSTQSAPNPSASYTGYPAIPSYFENLPEKMQWVKEMIGKSINIKEVVLDPEGPAGTGGIGDYQLLINFMDYFVTENQLRHLSNGEVNLGIALGISERNPTYANLSTFPNVLVTQKLNTLLPDNYPPLQTPGENGPEWRPNTKAALLNRVYLEAYQPNMPYIFTLKDNPELAATSLLHNFRDEPYLKGTGQINLVKGLRLVTGTGTKFLTGSQPLLQDMPIGIKNLSGTIVRAGLVREEPPTNTSFSFISPSTISTSSATGNQNFYQTEIINKWTFPYTTSAIAKNIYLMFSFSNQKNQGFPFFGTWTKAQFMSFINSLQNQGQTSLPIYYKDANTSIPLPSNFAIYDFHIFSGNITQ